MFRLVLSLQFGDIMLFNEFNRVQLIVKKKLIWYKAKFIFVLILTLIVTFGRVPAQ